MSQTTSLSEQEVLARLPKEAPRWTFDDGVLRRTFRTFGWKGSLLLANAIGHLAEAAWHHPDLLVSYDKVVVTLVSHDAGGVTERDMALAREIDRLADWRPEAASPLTGNPSDPAHGYLRYE